MKKLFSLISLTIMVVATIAYVTASTASAANLPATIQDPLLREGWFLLNQLTTPVTLWDGRSTSGHALAQFVVEHGIPIVWDDNNQCLGGSCSVRCKTANACFQSGGKAAMHPIFISLSYQVKKNNLLPALVDTLAHEIYHITLPFGAVDDTIYEEFTAYYIGEHIASNLLVNFENYDPLRPACLVKWFYDTQTLKAYQNLHAYPQPVLPLVDPSATTCLTPGNSTLETALQTPLTCSLNAEDYARCIFPVALPQKP